MAPTLWTGRTTAICPALAKLSVTGTVAPGISRCLRPNSIRWTPPGFRVTVSPGLISTPSGEAAHFHDVALHAHFMDLDFFGGGGRSAGQAIRLRAFILDGEIAGGDAVAPATVARVHGALTSMPPA